MNLFSKLKDYNAELDAILDKKTFSSNIKNLLLNLVYKLEISYKDFEIVKKGVRTKEDFLNEIIETIRLYCDNVKTVEPDSDQAKSLKKHCVKALTNTKERSILCYPTEIALLYAISDISPKYFYMNSNILIKNRFQNALVNGYIYNNVEILRDFSGWSWERTYPRSFEYIDNLIYYNLLVILGEKFLYDWRTYGSTRRDFIEEAKEYIKLFTDDEEYFKSIYKLLYVSTRGKEREKIDEIIKYKNEENEKLKNRIKYLEDAKLKKEKLAKQVEKITSVITNEEILKKQFDKLTDKAKAEKKVKSLITYKRYLMVEREKMLEEIERISFILKPINFIAYKQEIKEFTEQYNDIGTFEEVLIESQKNFLTFVYKRLLKMKTVDEIINVIYQLRYYRRLNVSRKTTIDDYEELEIAFDKVIKRAITQLCKLGGMRIVTMDINLNSEIIKYILDTKIIKLEQIKMAFAKDVDALLIRVYDKDIFEKQGRKKLDMKKLSLEVKTGHKIKLFG